MNFQKIIDDLDPIWCDGLKLYNSVDMELAMKQACNQVLNEAAKRADVKYDKKYMRLVVNKESILKIKDEL